MVDIVAQFVAVAAYIFALPLVSIAFNLLFFMALYCVMKITSDFITYIVDFFHKK